MTFLDQLGDTISFSLPPKKIISLVPSQTELLFDLGLDTEVAGITKFCVHPETWRSEKICIGGTKNFWFDLIDELQPDLIIGNKEENYAEGIRQLKKKYPVWMSDIACFDDALKMIRSVGSVTGKERSADVVVKQVEDSFAAIRPRSVRSVLYLIWKKPWMAAGTTTFIDDMLTKIGLHNCVQKERYPELSETTIKELNPDLIFLSSEPYPFKREHIAEMQQLVPRSFIQLVDGEFFSWYGSRMKHAPAYFNSLRLQ